MGRYQEQFRNILMKCVKKKQFRDLVKRVYTDAMAGDPTARKILFGRLLGKETQAIEISGIPIKLYDVGSSPENI